MKYFLTVFTLIFINNVAFSQEIPDYSTTYKIMQGLWHAPSDGEMDIVLDVGEDGSFTLSVLPAFEFENLDTLEQEDIIDQYVSSEGHIEIIELLPEKEGSTSIFAKAEILLNKEITTNILEITDIKIYRIENNNEQNVFLTKEIS